MTALEIICLIAGIWIVSFMCQALIEMIRGGEEYGVTELMTVRCILAPIFLPISIIAGICWLIYNIVIGFWCLIKEIPAAFLDFFGH